MNTPNDNPYTNSNPSPGNSPDSDKGSVLTGFFIGWGLMIGGSILTGIVISIFAAIASSAGNYYNNPLFEILGLVSLLMPIGIIVAGMVWFGKKGKSNIVKGIAAAIVSSIAIALLLVAACFGIVALSGGF
ncbi:MAG: hypothetical protein ACREO1_06255 [Arenimonas sp.]